MVKKTFKIKGLNCASCAQMIELDLEDAGVKAKCSFAKETLEVELTNLEKEQTVKKTLAAAGYEILT